MAQDFATVSSRLASGLQACNAAPSLQFAQIDAWLGDCREAMRNGFSDEAIPLLEALSRRCDRDGRVFTLLGHALRLEQRMTAARIAFGRAHDLNPDQSAPLIDLAQCNFELGLPAAGLFATAEARSGGKLELVRSHAAALVAEGRAGEGIDRLKAALKTHPGWIEGHKSLASFLWIENQGKSYADSLKSACEGDPKNAALWMTWFQLVAQIRDWPAALAILDAAQAALGETPGLLVSRLFVASESEDDAEAERLFALTQPIAGDVISLCRIRYLIRKRRPDEAEREILPRLATPSAPLFWPYASIVWRMLGDDRAEWLDRTEDLTCLAQAGLSKAEMDELAHTLRSLHTAQAPYPEQSVRGGTQTDRSVLLRHEPIFNRARDALLDVLRDFIAKLPPIDPRHPVLGLPRNHLLIEGSWSVRLKGQGYNVPHTHPKGWFSTAFYVTTPEPADMGPAPAGYLALGTPPVELKCGLGAVRRFEPAPGTLAIFPSILWHGTEPFEAGERMVIAFDIRRPDR